MRGQVISRRSLIRVRKPAAHGSSFPVGSDRSHTPFWITPSDQDKVSADFLRPTSSRPVPRAGEEVILVNTVHQAHCLLWTLLEQTGPPLSPPVTSEGTSSRSRSTAHSWDYRLICCFCLALSHVQLFAIPWTVARHPPRSMGILQARILEWVAFSFLPSFLPSPSQGIFPVQGSDLNLLHCRPILYHRAIWEAWFPFIQSKASESIDMDLVWRWAWLCVGLQLTGDSLWVSRQPRKEALRAESRWTRKTVRGFLPRAARGGPGTRVELGSYSSWRVRTIVHGEILFTHVLGAGQEPNIHFIWKCFITEH